MDLNTSFDAVYRALVNHGYAFDDHLPGDRSFNERTREVVVIASINGEAVFLEEIAETGTDYLVNSMGVDADGIAHITRSCITSFDIRTVTNLRDLINSHNERVSAKCLPFTIKDLTYLPKCFARYKSDGKSVALSRDVDGMYKVSMNDAGGVSSVTFHETKEVASTRFKKEVAYLMLYL